MYDFITQLNLNLTQHVTRFNRRLNWSLHGDARFQPIQLTFGQGQLQTVLQTEVDLFLLPFPDACRRNNLTRLIKRLGLKETEAPCQQLLGFRWRACSLVVPMTTEIRRISSRLAEATRQ